MPNKLAIYIAENNINKVVKRALNRILKEQPDNAIQALAAKLVASCQKSYPVFVRFEARPGILQDGFTFQTLVLDVVLTYQGRTRLVYTHHFTYDEAAHSQFWWDSQDEKSGLTAACDYINSQINPQLSGIVLNTNTQPDHFFESILAQAEAEPDQPPKKCIVKACSEALVYAVAKCFSPDNLYRGISSSFYQFEKFKDMNTNLMITVLNGGKSVGSAVKFSKFYLLIDCSHCLSTTELPRMDPMRILSFYQKFLMALRKQI